MSTYILVIHIVVSIFLVAVVLLQSGKGGAGSTFGGGESQTLLGTSGGSFMGKLTTVAAVIFMLTSLSLAYIASTSAKSSIMMGFDSEPKIEATQESANAVSEESSPAPAATASEAPVTPDQSNEK